MAIKAPFDMKTGALIPYAPGEIDWPLHTKSGPVEAEWRDASKPFFRVLKYHSFKNGPRAYLVLVDGRGNPYRMFLIDLEASVKQGFHFCEVLEGYWSVSFHHRRNRRGEGYWFGVRYMGSCPPKEETS